MRAWPLWFLILPLPLYCDTSKKYSAAANFAVDILGQPDSRPGTWGTEGSYTFKLRFKPPDGHRVRVLRAYGDFLVWPKGKVEQGRYAGALMALHTGAPDGSQRCDLCADNHLLYIQTATSGQPARAPFDFKFNAGLLGPDHTLYIKVAVWLNDTGLEIHCEPTFVAVYRFEDEDENGTP